MPNKEIDQAIRDKNLYFVGERLPADWYEAFRLWLPLAEAGDEKAQYNIGRCYSRGDGVDKDVAKAEAWFLKAAAQNNPRAYFNLYLFYSDSKDSEKAKSSLNKAIELEEPRAIFSLGKNCLLLGDKEKARSLFQKALDSGSKNAQLGLTACDTEISISHSTKTNHFSYTGDVYGTGGHVSGGGTRTGSYTNPTIVFKAKNNSPQSAIMSVWIQKYDYAAPDKKIGEAERLDFPVLAPNEISEIPYELHPTEESIRVYFISYVVWASRGGSNQSWEYFEFPKKVLAGELKKGSYFNSGNIILLLAAIWILVIVVM